MRPTVAAATLLDMTWWEERLIGCWLACAALAVIVSFAAPALAQDGATAPGGCTKSEFETVVDEAAAALRDLNAKNKPAFQDKLRQLKDKRGWTQDQFLKEAAPFVKDDKIEVFDKTSNQLLGKISSMGQEGSAAKTPDCAMLSELHAHMDVLVSTQTSKWTYMFGKLDAELGK
ncbi:MAG: hypothetical protein ACT4N2_09010 [Hyphomicrobium sp.]